MTQVNQTTLEKIANAIRGLSIDGVEAANSGHPGLPLGCAELGAFLYGEALHYNPKNPNWLNRDRFILSAGHGSMLLYSALHLAGYSVTLENLKKLEKVISKCKLGLSICVDKIQLYLSNIQKLSSQKPFKIKFEDLSEDDFV